MWRVQENTQYNPCCYPMSMARTTAIRQQTRAFPPIRFLLGVLSTPIWTTTNHSTAQTAHTIMSVSMAGFKRYEASTSARYSELTPPPFGIRVSFSLLPRPYIPIDSPTLRTWQLLKKEKDQKNSGDFNILSC